MTADVALLPGVLGAHVAAAAPADPITGALLEDPLGVIALRASSGDERVRADGLFGPAGYVLATDEPASELMTGPVGRLPLQLALLLDLGPRPVAARTVVAFGDPDELAGALDSGDVPAEIAAVAQAEGAARWSVRASWIAPDGPAERLVAVIDGGAAGLLLCAPGGEVALVTARTTDVWRALCGLLPYPSEIDDQ